MTITTLPTRNEYTATAGQAVFTYTFKIFESSDLNVYQTPAGAVSNDITDLITGYTVTGVGDEDGGTITLSTPASSGDLITIVSDIPESRTTDYQNNGDFRPDVVNDDFDRVVSLVKQINDNESRTLSFQESQQGASGLSLPKPSAGLLLRWNGAEDGLENVDFATPVDISIASVTALRNLSESDTYADGTIVSVLGYYTSGDGGGGQFYWDATSVLADNGGTVIKVTAITTGRWIRVYDGNNTNIMADWFGVIGDGITTQTDDSVKLQAIIDGFPGRTIELNSLKSHWLNTGLTVSDNGTSLYSSAFNANLFRTDQDIYMITTDAVNYSIFTNIGCNNVHAAPTRANYLIAGKTRNCIFHNLYSKGGRYGILFDAAQGSDPGGTFYNEVHRPLIDDTTEQNIYFSDAPGQNENHFFGGNLHNTNSNKILRLTGNNNKFFGTSFETDVAGADNTTFTVYEDGDNLITGCRFEADGHGVLVNSNSSTQAEGSRIFMNQWACNAVRVVCQTGRVFTDTHAQIMTLSGFYVGGTQNSTTVDVQSVSGQSVLSVADTDKFYPGVALAIDRGGSNEEWLMVTSYVDGVSITVTGNLQITHEVGETVETFGSLYGQVSRPENDSSVVEYWSQNQLAFKIDREVTTGSGYTGVYIRDVDNDVLQQLRIRGADTGGTGFRLVTVENN